MIYYFSDDIVQIKKIRGNILATENQQTKIDDVIEVKRACIFTKLKQMKLKTIRNTPSSNNYQFLHGLFYIVE